MTARVLADELLPVLLVLSPLLLLLDDLEPGFVRAVVNPYWVLVALVVVGIIAGQRTSTPSPASGGHASTSHGEGVRRGVGMTVLSLIAAILVGVWVWWRLIAGTLGVVVAVLTVVAIAAAMHAFPSDEV